MRRAGATYEEIAKAGGGIASTVKATQAASDDELLASAARRLDALMRAASRRSRSSPATGSTSTASCACSRCAPRRCRERAGAHCADPARAPRAARRLRTAATIMSAMIVDELIPPRRAASRPASTPSARASPSRRRRWSGCSRPRPSTACRVRLHAEQLPTSGAASWPRATRRCRPTISSISTSRSQGDGRGRHGRGAPARRLLRAAGERRSRRSTLLRKHKGADRHRDRLQPRHLALAVADAGDEHGLHPCSA